MFTLPIQRLQLVVLFAAVTCCVTPVRGQDCNGNGIPDADDIAAGTSQDCNGNGIPDECEIAGGAEVDPFQAAPAWRTFDRC